MCVCRCGGRDQEGCAPLATLPSQIDLAVPNAGVLTNNDFSTIKLTGRAWQFNTDALGPLRCVHALLPKLTDRSKVIIIGSKLGSFGETVPGRRVRRPVLLLHNCYSILSGKVVERKCSQQAGQHQCWAIGPNLIAQVWFCLPNIHKYYRNNSC